MLLKNIKTEKVSNINFDCQFSKTKHLHSKCKCCQCKKKNIVYKLSAMQLNMKIWLLKIFDY